MSPENTLLLDRVRHSPEWAAFAEQLVRLADQRANRLILGGLTPATYEGTAGEIRGLRLALAAIENTKRGNRGE